MAQAHPLSCGLLRTIASKLAMRKSNAHGYDWQPLQTRWPGTRPQTATGLPPYGQTAYGYVIDDLTGRIRNYVV